MDNRKIQLLKEALNEHNKTKRHPALFPALYTSLAALLFITTLYGLSLVKHADLMQSNLELESKLLDNSSIGYDVIPATYSQFEVLEDKAEDCDGLIMSVDDMLFCSSDGI